MDQSHTQPKQPEDRWRVLFMGEGVTLAHVARPAVLAQALDPGRYQVHLAYDPRFRPLFGDLPFALHAIHTIPSAQFLEALASGSPVYDAATLRRYVKEDLRLIEALDPDLIVGDFRLSLAISAPIAGVSYLTITNAYWSPYARQRFPLPELPLNRMVGVPTARLLFRLVRPLAFAYHTLPLNRVRREYGLPSLGLDLRRIYTHADYTLYADIPALFPTSGAPPSHHYLGPVLWSPPVPLPAWWDALPADQPLIYITLGSSGAGDLLPTVLKALAPLPIVALAATAGRVQVSQVAGNAYVTDFLPGETVTQRASVVICNGGSPTVQQALAAGCPVLGICSNMDQYLNMEAVQAHGAGLLLRAGRADAETIGRAVNRLLREAPFGEVAAKMATLFTQYSAPQRFAGIVAAVLDRAKRSDAK